mgnify:CR=1 FL=1
MNNYETIAEAIAEKKAVEAVCHGCKRAFCPHVLGEKNGRVQALVYQFAGESNSSQILPGSTNNWRCLVIDLLEQVRILDEPWHTADNHSRPQTCVGIIHCQVELN